MRSSDIMSVDQVVAAYAEIDRLHAESRQGNHKDAEAGAVRFRNGSRVAELQGKINRSQVLVMHALHEALALEIGIVPAGAPP